MPSLRIGALAERAGTNAPTVRYYEEIGLLRPADRQASGQRIYRATDEPSETALTSVAMTLLDHLVPDKNQCQHNNDTLTHHLIKIARLGGGRSPTR